MLLATGVVPWDWQATERDSLTSCTERTRKLPAELAERCDYDNERRRWDLNPRTLAGHTISNRADSAALALLRAGAVGAGGASGYLVGSALPRAAAGFCATGGP